MAAGHLQKLHSDKEAVISQGKQPSHSIPIALPTWSALKADYVPCLWDYGNHINTLIIHISEHLNVIIIGG